MLHQLRKVIDLLRNYISSLKWLIFPSQANYARGLIKFALCGLFLSHTLFAVEMKDLLPKNPLIFDVGAHKGVKTEYYLSLGAKTVVCVEPQPLCLEVLNSKFKDNSKITIVPLGLSDQKGEISFYVCSEAPAISSASIDWQKGRFSGNKYDQKSTIATTTLDELVKSYGTPDFCKIDVEGYELNVLKGLKEPIPFLSIEFAHEFLEQKTKLCLEYLSHLGYKSFNVAFGDSEIFALNEWVTGEELLATLKNNPDRFCWGDIYARY